MSIIDLAVSDDHILTATDTFAGYAGEHNANSFVIVSQPVALDGYTRRMEFSLGGAIKVWVDVDATGEIPLTHALTVRGNNRIQVVWYDSVGNIVAKSSQLIYVIGPSVNALEPMVYGLYPDPVQQILDRIVALENSGAASQTAINSLTNSVAANTTAISGMKVSQTFTIPNADGQTAPAPGWYRVARNVVSPRAARCSAVFNFENYPSNHTIGSVFACSSYGLAGSLNQLSFSAYQGIRGVQRARIVSSRTGSSATMETYLDFYHSGDASGTNLRIDMINSMGWVLLPTADLQSDPLPTGYFADAITFAPGIGTTGTVIGPVDIIGPSTLLTTGADLNYLTSPGVYYTTGSTLTDSLLNCPVTGVAIRIRVVYVSTTLRVQELTSNGSIPYRYNRRVNTDTTVTPGVWARTAIIDSPGFTGNPTAPTQAQTVNNTRIATTEYVRTAVNALISSMSGVLPAGAEQTILNELEILEEQDALLHPDTTA